jgi:hypothetical protein
VRDGAGPLVEADEQLQAVRALLDVRTRRAFQLQGLSTAATGEAVGGLVASLLER